MHAGLMGAWGACCASRAGVVQLRSSILHPQLRSCQPCQAASLAPLQQAITADGTLRHVVALSLSGALLGTPPSLQPISSVAAMLAVTSFLSSLAPSSPALPAAQAAASSSAVNVTGPCRGPRHSAGAGAGPGGGHLQPRVAGCPEWS